MSNSLYPLFKVLCDELEAPGWRFSEVFGFYKRQNYQQFKLRTRMRDSSDIIGSNSRSKDAESSLLY